MRGDPVAHRLARVRPGFDLVAKEPCLLPVSSIWASVTVLIEEPIPVIDEFLLRAVAAGLDHLAVVSQILGLRQEDLIGAVVGHQRDGNMRVTWRGSPEAPGDQSRVDAVLELTPKGLTTATELSRKQPEKREIPLVFDRLTWKLVLAKDAISSRDAKALGWRRIPPAKTRRPTTADLSAADIDSLIGRELPGVTGRVSVLGIDSMRAEDQFLPADLLVYQSADGETTELGLAVHDRADEVRDRALAAIGGAERLEITITKAPPLDPAKVPRDVLEQLPPIEVELDVRREIASSNEALRRLEEAVTPDEPVDAEAAPDEIRLATAEARERAAEQKLDELPVRRIETFEHADLLDRALRHASTRLLIISPWITPAVVNKDFLTKIEGRCRSGVRIHIGYGIAPEDPSEPEDNQATQGLERLAAQFENLTLVRLGDTHAKILIWDGAWISTSFNWLSFRGDRRRAYRQEEGILVTDGQIVEREYADLMVRRFGEVAGLTATMTPETRECARLMAMEESKTLEFKSAARYNLRSKQRDEVIEHVIAKTVTAFLNSEGGQLLIGVNDDGEVVGLVNDYKLCGNKGRDGFENWLTGLLEARLGGAALGHIRVRFEAFPPGDVCLVEVGPSPSPVYLRTQDDVSFFIRANNSSRQLSIDQAHKYIEEHFRPTRVERNSEA